MSPSSDSHLRSPQELNGFLSAIFPGSEQLFSVDSVNSEGIILRCIPTEKHLRPGGTVSGPLLMAMADTAMYLALFSRLGPATMAVTSNLSINFLRKANLSELIGHTRLLKVGSRLASGDVTIFVEGNDEPVAHASVTYSIPPKA